MRRYGPRDSDIDLSNEDFDDWATDPRENDEPIEVDHIEGLDDEDLSTWAVDPREFTE